MIKIVEFANKVQNNKSKCIGATLMIVVYRLIRTEGPPINEVPISAVPIISALSASFPA